MDKTRRVFASVSVLATMAFASGVAAQEPVVPEPIAQERVTTRGARAELVTGQTVHGIALASEICALASCNSARAWAGAMLTGAGTGLALSLTLSRNGVTPSQAYGVNAGMVFGAWHGYAIYAAASPFFGDRSDGVVRGLVASIIGGQALGVTAGLLLDRAFHPSAGDMAFATGLAGWATGISAMVGIATQVEDGFTDTGVRAFHGALVAITDLGLVLGGLLASRVHPSRGRTLIMHAGGALGGGLAPLAAWLIGGDDISAGALIASSAAGAALGLGLTYFLTRDFDADGPAVDISFAPTRGGATATLQMAL